MPQCLPRDRRLTLLPPLSQWPLEMVLKHSNHAVAHCCPLVGTPSSIDGSTQRPYEKPCHNTILRKDPNPGLKATSISHVHLSGCFQLTRRLLYREPQKKSG